MAGILSRMRIAGNGSMNKVYSGHMKRVFPELGPASLKKLLRSYWRVHQRAFLGFFYSRRFRREMLAQLVSLNGVDVLDRAVSRGRGVLLLVPHFGDERMLHILLAMAGYRMHVISSRYEGAPEVVREARLSVSMQWHHVAFPDQPLGWLYGALERGEVVQISPTAYGGPRGHWVWSLGVPVLASSTPVRIAASTGCSLVVAYNRSLPDMRYEISFEDFHPSGMDARGTSELFSRYNQLAREFPEQYSWMNLVIRHRETNTIARLGAIPSDETLLEKEAVYRDWDPLVVQDPGSISSISSRSGSALV
jgi:KDO2-lipid IV(A) lauroyltransferase